MTIPQTRRVRIGPHLALLTVALLGCEALSPTPSGPEVFQGRGSDHTQHVLDSVPSHPHAPIHGPEAQAALRAGDYATALDRIRLEIAAAEVREPGYRADVRTWALEILWEYQRYHGPSDALDREAQRYFEEGERLAASDERRRSNLHYSYGMYFSQTGRNGRALPYIQAELEYWTKRDDAFHVSKSLDALANIYNDMGALILRDRLRKRALEKADSFFRFPDQPADPTQWRSYERFLFHAAAEAAEEGRGEALVGLWGKIRPIADRFGESPYRSYLEMAQLFAASNEIDRAREIVGAGAELARGDASEKALSDLACAEASVHLYAAQIEPARERFERCVALRRSGGRDVDAGTAYLAGRAFEAAGELQRSMELYRHSTRRLEVARESYSVGERIAFFRGTARKAYWGLIRASVKHGRASGDAAELFYALHTSELVRARQLGDRAARKPLSLTDLRRMQNELSPDQLILAYLLTETEIVVFGVSRNEITAERVAYEPDVFAGRVEHAARLLADPRSSTRVREQALARIGELLLRPVASLLEDRRRLIVLLDGSLHRLPFDQLGDPTRSGRPLFENFVVRSEPSLQFLLRTPDPRQPEATLFALADPIYTDSDRPPRPGFDADSPAPTPDPRHVAPLPETRREVRRIAQIAGDERSKLLLGSKATESLLKRTDLRGYRFLHFAAHGVPGGVIPGIVEPALVLGRDGGEEDGFLTASEASLLQTRAELTVLSACKSGSGEYVTGEGVLGLARSFLISGSRSVLVSLWNVDSAATEALMISFYRSLLTGTDVSEALHRAKRDLRDGSGEPQWSPYRHPFYWAGFVLVGGGS